MRFLAIDYGGKRTGLAIASDVLGVGTPLSVIHAEDDAARLAGIKAAIDEHGPDELVLGLPLNMDGSEGPAAENIRRFARLLAESSGLKVHLVDERLSSFEAQTQGKSTSKNAPPHDALAAKLIVERFLGKG